LSTVTHVVRDPRDRVGDERVDSRGGEEDGEVGEGRRPRDHEDDVANESDCHEDEVVDSSLSSLVGPL